MAAPTIAEVKEVKPTVLVDADITSRIAAAGTISGKINDKCGTSFSTAELEEIQLWLAAHLVAITDPDSKRETISKTDIDITYMTGKLGMYIESTFYGQTANMLAGGCLAQFSERTPQIFFSGSAQGRTNDV
jgi:hypothetical protein